MMLHLLLLSLACLTPSLCHSHKPVCIDEHYQVRNDGESWRKDCNTCKCVRGNISCTKVHCGDIGGNKLCTCINPFYGEIDEHIGDRDVTCNKRRNPFCYVDCQSDCRDIKAARGKGRCYSKIACFDDIVAADVHVGGR